MNVFELTRALVDIESVTNAEKRVGNYLYDHLSTLAEKYDGHVERMRVEAERFNVFAHWGDPLVTLSTHMDTVPPFFPSREDQEFIWGRGACDAKGHHCGDGCGGGKTARRRAQEFRAAVCCGRRA